MSIPQTMPVSTKQVTNKAGGFVFAVTDLQRLKRFLCIGSQGGTYYVKERTLTKQNADCIVRMIAEGKGKLVVDTIKKFSVEGRTAKQNPLLFALALCARSENIVAKQEAYKAFLEICRIPTHVFIFVEFCEALSVGTGWGRAHRRAVGNWYNSKDANQLAFHLTKYRNRNNWTHKDILRLTHTKPANDAQGLVIRYIVKSLEDAKKYYTGKNKKVDEGVSKVIKYLSAVEEAKSSKDEDRLVELIARHNLVREHIPTTMLSSAKVWRGLLQKMPMTALIRSLGKLSNVRLLTADSEEEGIVTRQLRDAVVLRKARVHPFNVLVTLSTYENGSGDKGKLSWPVNPNVVNSLNDAFYITFKYVEPTNKRLLLAVDVSKSMDMSRINGAHSVTARDGAAAMIMATLRSEEFCDVVAFSSTLTDLGGTSDDTLSSIKDKMIDLHYIVDNTDCALPMVYAKEQSKMYDAFVIYTDNKTWTGVIHPHEALVQYRISSGIQDARLIVCGMTSTEFTIADPDDPGMLDIVGFDSSAPEVMREFIMGNI